MNETPTAPQQEARTFCDFMKMLEDGRLAADLSDDLRDLNAEMNNHAQTYGGTVKGKMTITLDFTLAKGSFDIVADVKTVKPQAKRDRSIAWSTPDNNFSPDNPRQMQLFGPPRGVADEPREIRTV